LDGVDNHRGERDFLIEGVLPNALVKIDREVDRGLAKTFAILRANARLFLRSTTTRGAPCLQLESLDPRTCRLAVPLSCRRGGSSAGSLR
jgi:hypothetical protein